MGGWQAACANNYQVDIVKWPSIKNNVCNDGQDFKTPNTHIT